MPSKKGKKDLGASNQIAKGRPITAGEAWGGNGKGAFSKTAIRKAAKKADTKFLMKQRKK